MKVKPLGKRLVIELSEKRTKSGLVIPNGELDEVATVLEVGCDVDFLSKGDKVIYNKFAGYTLNDPLHRIIEEKDILAKVED